MLARPLFRERHRPDMSEEEATTLLHDALRVRPACRQVFTLTLPVFCRLPGCLTALNSTVSGCLFKLSYAKHVEKHRCAITAISRQPTNFRLPRSRPRACRCQTPLRWKRSGAIRCAPLLWLISISLRKEVRLTSSSRDAGLCQPFGKCAGHLVKKYCLAWSGCVSGHSYLDAVLWHIKEP